MIGATRNDGNGYDTGHVRVYRWRKYTQLDDANPTYHYTSREQGTDLKLILTQIQALLLLSESIIGLN